MNLTERLQEAFDKRVCGTAMLPASDLLSAMTAIEQAEAENAALKEQCAQQAEAIRLKDAALEKIACIGNGDTHGNSIGNCLAIDALAIQPSPEILQARDEKVAEACAKAVIAYNGQCDAHVLASQLICGEWRKHI